MHACTSSASSVPVSLSSPHTCEPGNPGQNQYSCRWDASGALKIVHVFELHKVEIIFRPVTGSQLAVTLQLRSHSSLTFFIAQHQSRRAAYWKWLALQNKKGLACKTSNYPVIKLCWLWLSRWCTSDKNFSCSYTIPMLIFSVWPAANVNIVPIGVIINSSPNSAHLHASKLRSPLWMSCFYSLLKRGYFLTALLHKAVKSPPNVKKNQVRIMAGTSTMADLHEKITWYSCLRIRIVLCPDPTQLTRGEGSGVTSPNPSCMLHSHT